MQRRLGCSSGSPGGLESTSWPIYELMAGRRARNFKRRLSEPHFPKSFPGGFNVHCSQGGELLFEKNEPLVLHKTDSDCSSPRNRERLHESTEREVLGAIKKKASTEIK